MIDVPPQNFPPGPPNLYWVESVLPHPGSTSLRVARLRTVNERFAPIVFGGAHVESVVPGAVVAAVLPGQRLPTAEKNRPHKVRGVVSNGEIASLSELGAANSLPDEVFLFPPDLMAEHAPDIFNKPETDPTAAAFWGAYRQKPTAAFVAQRSRLLNEVFFSECLAAFALFMHREIEDFSARSLGTISSFADNSVALAIECVAECEQVVAVEPVDLSERQSQLRVDLLEWFEALEAPERIRAAAKRQRMWNGRHEKAKQTMSLVGGVPPNQLANYLQKFMRYGESRQNVTALHAAPKTLGTLTVKEFYFNEKWLADLFDPNTTSTPGRAEEALRHLVGALRRVSDLGTTVHAMKQLAVLDPNIGRLLEPDIADGRRSSYSVVEPRYSILRVARSLKLLAAREWVPQGLVGEAWVDFANAKKSARPRVNSLASLVEKRAVQTIPDLAAIDEWFMQEPPSLDAEGLSVDRPRQGGLER